MKKLFTVPVAFLARTLVDFYSAQGGGHRYLCRLGALVCYLKAFVIVFMTLGFFAIATTTHAADLTTTMAMLVAAAPFVGAALSAAHWQAAKTLWVKGGTFQRVNSGN